MESGWNLWVWLVGVVSRRWVWLVGGIYGYGYNVWVWLVGVVMRYIDILIIIINFTYSTCIRSFFGSSILTSLFIFKMFFRSCIIINTLDRHPKSDVRAYFKFKMHPLFTMHQIHTVGRVLNTSM